MKKYFIETSVIIGYLRGEKETIALLDKLEDEFSSSFICLAELYEGIYRVASREKIEKGVLDFFAGLSEVYGLDYDIAKIFGQIRMNLKRRGNVIEDLDLLLAATCLTHGLTMITYNAKHFARVEGLELLGVGLNN